MKKTDSFVITTIREKLEELGHHKDEVVAGYDSRHQISLYELIKRFESARKHKWMFGEVARFLASWGPALIVAMISFVSFIDHRSGSARGVILVAFSVSMVVVLVLKAVCAEVVRIEEQARLDYGELRDIMGILGDLVSCFAGRSGTARTIMEEHLGQIAFEIVRMENGSDMNDSKVQREHSLLGAGLRSWNNSAVKFGLVSGDLRPFFVEAKECWVSSVARGEAHTDFVI